MGRLVLAKSGRLKQGNNVLRTLHITITVRYLACKAIKFREKKSQIRAIKSCKVT